MFDIGMPEFLLIAAIALIVVGPEKLPDIAKTIGRMFGELKKTTNDFKQTIESEINLKDLNNIDTSELVDKAEIVNKQDETETALESGEDKKENKDEAGHENKNRLEKESEQGTTKDERG